MSYGISGVPRWHIRYSEKKIDASYSRGGGPSIGVEGMFDGSGMQGCNTDASGLFIINSKIPWLATVTGRIGLTPPPRCWFMPRGRRIGA